MSFCFKSSYFSFDLIFEHQESGCSMGNPVSPVFANLVMQIALETIMNKLPFELPSLNRYVDDLSQLPTNEIEKVFNIFNSYDVDIQFTMERENNCSLPFLDK